MKSALSEIKNASMLEPVEDHILSHLNEYDITELILPDGEKSIYQRCANIICKMPIEFIANHAVELMEWFQDLNWPGTDQIFDALCYLPIDKLVSAIKKGIENADLIQDEEWAYNIREKFEKYIG